MEKDKLNSGKINFSSKNERVFNQGADRLRTPERIKRLEIKKVVDLCLERSDIKSVLDIGTGSGLFSEEFSKRGLRVNGVDTNPEMVTAAKRFVPQGMFKTAPAEEIPFNDSEFDLTFMGLVFHEVDDYLKALKEAGRTAAKEVAMLEWYYKTEDFGPPLEHRLKKDFIKNLAEEVSLKNFEAIELEYLVLYRFSK